MAFPPEPSDETDRETVIDHARAQFGPNVTPNHVRRILGLPRLSKRLRLIDDPDYVRQLSPDGEEIGVLGYECGSHCVVQMAGKHQLVRHCPCEECHDGKEVVYGSPKEV